MIAMELPIIKLTKNFKHPKEIRFKCGCIAFMFPFSGRVIFCMEEHPPEVDIAEELVSKARRMYAELN